MPALVVLVEQNPQKTQRKNHARYSFSDQFSDEHRKKACGTAVFFNDSHAEEIFAWSCPSRKENERPDDVRDKQKGGEEAAEPGSRLRLGGSAGPGDE